MKTLNRRLPLTSIFALAIALLALLSFSGVLSTKSLRAERFYVKEFPLGARAACRNNQAECLIIVNKSERGWRGSQLDAALSTMGGWFGLVSDTPDPLQSQAELLRLSDDGTRDFRVERRDTGGLDISGEFVADGDSLFYVSYYTGDDEDNETEDEDEPRSEKDSPSLRAKGWRWEGQNFSVIPEEQAKQLAERGLKERRQRVRRQFSGRADRKESPDIRQVPDAGNTSAEGWDLYDLYVSVPDTDLPDQSSFKLAGADWSLRFQHEGDPLNPLEGTATLKLVRVAAFAPEASPKKSEQVLARYGDKWEQVDAARYGALANSQMPAYAARYFGRHFVPAGIIQLITFLTFLTMTYWILRYRLNNSASSTNFFPDARPENFPALDRAALEHYTHELEALGFVHLRDYTVPQPSSKYVLPGFGRLFANPALNCFAEVGQVFTVKKNPLFAGMSCSIISHFSDRRTFATANREPISLSYALRRPQNLWSARPGASVTQLLEWHLEVRREIELVVDVRISADLTPESFFAHVTESIENQRTVLKKRTRLLLPLLVEDMRLRTKKRYDWLGDYSITPAPLGWFPPQSAGTPDANPYPRSGMQATLSNWVGIINFVSGTAIHLSLYFWVFQPSQQRGGLIFRAGLSAIGLLGFVLLKIANRQQA